LTQRRIAAPPGGARTMFLTSPYAGHKLALPGRHGWRRRREMNPPYQPKRLPTWPSIASSVSSRG
jgi:hypothetical protein